MGLEQVKEGARLLQEADVSNIVSSLSIGIAEAQAALDENSVKQTLLLAKKDKDKFSGKSLLELGFTAAFYHFQHADVSASISLRMKEKRQTDVDVSADAKYNKTSGVSQDSSSFLEETENADYQKGYKSSREFVMESSETKELTVSSSSMKLDHTAGSISKVEKFENQLRQSSEIERVLTEIRAKELAVVSQTTSTGVVVNNSLGFITITLPEASTEDFGLLKVGSYPATPDAVDLDGAGGSNAAAAFDITTDFDTTYPLAKAANVGGTTIGFSKSEIRNGSVVLTMPLTVNFEWDKHFLKGGYHNNPTVMPYLQKLAYILKNDPSAEVKVIGYTDGSGEIPYNTKLSEKRAKAVRQWLLDQGVADTQVSIEFKGEVLANGSTSKDVELRKVTIELTSDDDYIYFEGGLFDVTATPAPGSMTTAGNGFLDTVAGVATPANYTIAFDIGSAPFSFTGVSSLNGLVLDIKNSTTNSAAFSAEVVNNTAYLLHSKSLLKFSVLSKTTDEVEVKEKESSSSSNTQNASSHLISKAQNSKTKLEQESNNVKDPSSFAVGGSVDVRTSRQFDLSVEGNASVSVRLVSLPAPPEFLEEIKAYLS